MLGTFVVIVAVVGVGLVAWLGRRFIAAEDARKSFIYDEGDAPGWIPGWRDELLLLSTRQRMNRTH